MIFNKKKKNKKRSRFKRGDTVECIHEIDNFTVGAWYKVMGNAPIFRIILLDDKGSRAFPQSLHFKKVSFIKILKKKVYGG